ncbi:hypothetical protein T459_31736 [Capsicum annuum]|uniref:Integrase zinc-binding domain-containing protein n=1 Tax=Capsicum annuum TaxID=4072 RepID=A0A2G2Y3Q8_CAPAN|nr:hypothetical protein FXO37_28562 [Capsicum annuum]PHT64385.1 hypothetical protein T459_31736 [Capsicum annuum]
MSLLYHPIKANVVADALSRLSMGSISHVDDSKKKLVQEVHQLARLGVRLVDSSESGVYVQSSLESSLVSEVKEKQDKDPSLVKLKESVQNQKIEVFSQGGDGILLCQGRLCVPSVDDIRQRILAEVHGARYSIHPGATKMYRNLRKIYWWSGMKRDVAEFVAKCSTCQKVKIDHHKPSCPMQKFSIPTWKWEVMNMDFVMDILMQHCSPTLLQYHPKNTGHKLTHTSSGIRNQIRSVLGKLIELQAVLLNRHEALPQVHELLNLCLSYLKRKELVQ